jgi:hypothetical protein
MNKLKIENHDDLLRDTTSNAVINNDMSALENYRKRRKAKREMMSDVDNLKNDVQEIKELLKQLLEKNR